MHTAYPVIGGQGEEDNDDAPIGRIHTRREVLALFGAAGAATITAGLIGRAVTGPSAVSAATSCVVTPALEEGPYFVDDMLYRSNITTDPTTGTAQPGVPLTLTWYLSRVNGTACTPLSGATVDIWHANYAGTYSDEAAENTSGQKWLRGTQISDANGMVQFTTVYPGWYGGRAVHIHAKVRTSPGAASGYTFNTQLFFDDTLTNSVYTTYPYSTRGTRSTLNSADRVYATGGNATLLTLTGSNTAGYAATFSIGISTTAITATSTAAPTSTTAATATPTTVSGTPTPIPMPGSHPTSGGGTNPEPQPGRHPDSGQGSGVQLSSTGGAPSTAAPNPQPGRH